MVLKKAFALQDALRSEQFKIVPSQFGHYDDLYVVQGPLGSLVVDMAAATQGELVRLIEFPISVKLSEMW